MSKQASPVCPNCGAGMTERGCKWICLSCGYAESCSEGPV